MERIITWTEMTSQIFSIYLADLRYSVGGSSFPLGIGYLASYVEKILPGRCQITLFIDPEKLTAAIRHNPPDLVGLANYSWNRNINTQLTQFTKSIDPNIVTVMGGPCFARDDQDWLVGFFARNNNLDFYLSGAGEFGFAELVRNALESYENRNTHIRAGAFPGLFYRDGNSITEGNIQVPNVVARRRDLDEIPSPYLTGLMDEFFEQENLGPLIETVRGCPYACTFCCWGSRLLNKVSMFSLERVKAELDYIAARATKCRRLFFGDANFGIIERDVDVAKHLVTVRGERHWPDDVYMYFAKNSGDRVVKIASLLKNMTRVSMARQSMNVEVLANTKRTNLSDEAYARIQDELGANDVESMVEFIYPLPGETRSSFIEGLQSLFSQIDPIHTEIRFYPTELLPGSEMATTASREKFGLISGWRRLSGQTGEFDGFTAGEYQEIVVATDSFSMADQSYIRNLHFLMALFLTYGLYSPFIKLHLEKNSASSIVAMFDRIMQSLSDDTKLSTFIKAFEDDSRREFSFDGEPAPDGQDVSGAPNQKRYNIYYILKLWFADEGRYRQAFHSLLSKTAIEYFGISADEVSSAIEEVERNIIDYDKIAAERLTAPEYAGKHPAIKVFSQSPEEDTVNRLYKLYSEIGAGHLERIVLYEY